MKDIIIATSNQHKIKEYKQLLSGYNVLSLKDINFNDEILENGKTFEENALIKAKTISLFLRQKGIFVDVLSDDSGLCVSALGGSPGVHSARYAGEHDAKANRTKLLDNLEGKVDRYAYFCCDIVLYRPNDTYIVGEGKTFGSITKQEIGDTSFGYDCIFYSDELNKTFGEASMEEKNKVSHRFKALEDLLNKLEKN